MADDPSATRRGTRGLIAVAVLGVAATAFCLTSITSASPDPVSVGLAAQAGQAAAPAAAQHAAPGQVSTTDGGVTAAPVLVAQPAAAPAAKAASPKANAISIDIMNFSFMPDSVSIAVGDTVIWTNMDQAPHNVVVSEGPEQFTSPLLAKGESFTFTFTKEGTYRYYCSVHPDMPTATVIAGDGTTPPGQGGDCAVTGALKPFIDHIKAAHLEESPGQQLQDIADLDKYIKTHTVLVEKMLDPLFKTLSGAPPGILKPLFDHLKAAHLEESLGQQLRDLQDFDKYVKTHTVLIEKMLDPAFKGGC